MAKDINLTSEKWIDMVFEGKNKDFGAYTLRKNSPTRHTFAFLAVLTLVVLIVVGSIAYSSIKKAMEAEKEKMTEVTQLSNIELDTPEEIPEEEQIKQYEAPPPVELKTTVQFTAPVIKKDEEVPKEQEVKTQDEFIENKAQISIKTVKGTNDETGIDIADLEKNKVIVQKEEPKVEQVFDIVEIPPSFPGGDAAMYEWLGQNIHYPQIAQENAIQGKVIIQFVVGKTGSIEDVKVVRGVEPSIDKEAVRVVKSMPKWIPGKQGGNAVKVRYTLPVQFKLQS